jgi:hypothetical protein
MPERMTPVTHLTPKSFDRTQVFSRGSDAGNEAAGRESKYRTEVASMKQVQIQRPKPAPAPQPIDLRTPSGRRLPF